MEDSEMHVMSEIHLGCPPATSGPFFSRFTFSSSVPLGNLEDAQDSTVPSNAYCIPLDEDGDLLLPRRRPRRGSNSFTVTIKHCITSTLTHVGLQSLSYQILCCTKCSHPHNYGTVCLELGAGTGLLGILLARVAKAVFLTDYGDEILDNCVQNVEMKSSLFNPQAVVNVCELNWMSRWPVEDIHGGDCRDPKKYCWSLQEYEQVKNASFIFAADVIYNDDLTRALVRMLKRVMSFGCEKVLYLGLEKRYNFSLDDLNVVANGYACFRSYIKEEDEVRKKRRRRRRRRRGGVLWANA